jgi:hypothetical protein
MQWRRMQGKAALFYLIWTMLAFQSALEGMRWRNEVYSLKALGLTCPKKQGSDSSSCKTFTFEQQQRLDSHGQETCEEVLGSTTYPVIFPVGVKMAIHFANSR